MQRSGQKSKMERKKTGSVGSLLQSGLQCLGAMPLFCWDRSDFAAGFRAARISLLMLIPHAWPWQARKSVPQKITCHMPIGLSALRQSLCVRKVDIFIASRDHQSQISVSDHFVYRTGKKLGMSGFIPPVDSQLSYSKPKPLLVTLAITHSNCQPARVDNSKGKLSVCFNLKLESWWKRDFSCRNQ